METTGTTALSPSNSPPTQISTHGEFNSPGGCRGTFGSVGTAEATRIETDLTQNRQLPHGARDNFCRYKSVVVFLVSRRSARENPRSRTTMASC
jgi:hypothetical protein